MRDLLCNIYVFRIMISFEFKIHSSFQSKKKLFQFNELNLHQTFYHVAFLLASQSLAKGINAKEMRGLKSRDSFCSNVIDDESCATQNMHCHLLKRPT